jgi:hypothetical protein
MSRQPKSVETRFWEKVDKTGDCWIWTGAKSSAGYGTLAVHLNPLKVMAAHRLSFALHRGVFDQRLMVLHTCDVRECVRPDHLYLGDHLQNMKDMVDRGRHGKKMGTHCPAGHAYTESNTYERNGSKWCRECRKAQTRKHRQSKKGGTHMATASIEVHTP